MVFERRSVGTLRRPDPPRCGPWIDEIVADPDQRVVDLAVLQRRDQRGTGERRAAHEPTEQPSRLRAGRCVTEAALLAAHDWDDRDEVDGAVAGYQLLIDFAGDDTWTGSLTGRGQPPLPGPCILLAC